MFRFTIRDVLWLTVVVAIAASWWIDNQRIEKGVVKLENDRRLMQEDFQDKMLQLDEMQKQNGRRIIRVNRQSP
jgi:hypothetical protein